MRPTGLIFLISLLLSSCGAPTEICPLGYCGTRVTRERTVDLDGVRYALQFRNDQFCFSGETNREGLIIRPDPEDVVVISDGCRTTAVTVSGDAPSTISIDERAVAFELAQEFCRYLLRPWHELVEEEDGVFFDDQAHWVWFDVCRR